MVQFAGDRDPGPDITLGWNIPAYRWTADPQSLLAVVYSKCFPNDGIITQWSFIPINTNPFNGVVLRRIYNNNWKWWEIVGVNQITGTVSYELNTYDVPLEDQIYVKQGDCLGLHFPVGGVVWLDGHSASDSIRVLYDYMSISQMQKGTRLYVSRSTYRAYSLQLIVKSSK